MFHWVSDCYIIIRRNIRCRRRHLTNCRNFNFHFIYEVVNVCYFTCHNHEIVRYLKWLLWWCVHILLSMPHAYCEMKWKKNIHNKISKCLSRLNNSRIKSFNEEKCVRRNILCFMLHVFGLIWHNSIKKVKAQFILCHFFSSCKFFVRPIFTEAENIYVFWMEIILGILHCFAIQSKFRVHKRFSSIYVGGYNFLRKNGAERKKERMNKINSIKHFKASQRTWHVVCNWLGNI